MQTINTTPLIISEIDVIFLLTKEIGDEIIPST